MFATDRADTATTPSLRDLRASHRRDGARPGPEVSATLEVSAGGAGYTLLGSGCGRGQWTLSGLSLPHTTITIRARGYDETE